MNKFRKWDFSCWSDWNLFLHFREKDKEEIKETFYLFHNEVNEVYSQHHPAALQEHYFWLQLHVPCLKKITAKWVYYKMNESKHAENEY